MLGITTGFTIMVLALGLGLSEMFETFPVFHQMLRYGGAAYPALSGVSHHHGRADGSGHAARGRTAADVPASRPLPMGENRRVG